MFRIHSIASIPQKDTELYALRTLQVEQKLLTDAPAIHNLVTKHFTDWYRSPTQPVDWPSLLKDQTTFQALVDSKAIPAHLTLACVHTPPAAHRLTTRSGPGTAGPTHARGVQSCGGAS